MPTAEVGHAADPPAHIMGYTIRSRTRIYVSYIIPSCLGLLVFMVQTATDLALSSQYFRVQEIGYGVGTLILVLIPPLLTFILVLLSREQRCSACGERSKWKSFCLGLQQLLIFPFVVLYRFTMRFFWSIEALFHDEDDVERMKCLAKATQTSSIELYLLIQAYAQAAPQIILQINHMLLQGVFRNYETTTLQAMCLVFSAIDLAGITTSYHRMESQRRVGRHYPWATPQQVATHRCQLEQNQRLCGEAEQRKRESERTLATSFPQSDKIMQNFHARQAVDSPEVDTHVLHVTGMDEVDNDAVETLQTQALLHSPIGNATDDDKLHRHVRPKLQLQQREQMANLDRIDVLDSVPETPAPPPPPATAPPALPMLRLPTENSPPELQTPDLRRTMSDNEHRRSRRVTRPLSQLETFKDMLLVNAQLYIKEHVPRPPKLLVGRLDEEPEENERTPLVVAQTPKGTPLTPEDVVDFYFPRRTKIVNGIQQDDFAGRTIAFFGWIAFIIMRMLSLATFCFFYPRAFFIIVGVHYALMLAALALETRCRGGWNRTLFYLVLGYIYIFVLLEFRVCFKSIRVWYGLYLVLILVENITMSSIWYANEEFASWWFGFIWEWIVYSGILFLATIVVYYCLLRPKDVSLIVEDEPAAQSPSPSQSQSVA
ncbi:uncharacterized protein LOC133845547 [Drosophila sulfurigaster albostrigata]|uniref:uncharacterized protein LOC133845547 n=1 Tax=Drosophila sulfurigaster albostrigata TaxID=89887 RepID=UPI002D21D1CD|nr:uncharacterized protein LOC133845547 [Drosophila sulfurigaster albostrigata]